VGFFDERSSEDDVFAEFERRTLERRRERAAKARRVRRRLTPRVDVGADELRHLAGSRAGRLLVAVVGALALATIVGLVALAPGGDAKRAAEPFGPTFAAHVVASHQVACVSPTPQACRKLTVRVGERTAPLTLGPIKSAPRVGPGDTVRVSRTYAPKDAPLPPRFEPYSFVDVDRHGSILVLALIVAAVAIVTLRVRGALAVVGVVLSLLLVVKWLVPAILAGHPPILVALVGSSMVMFITLVLTNGIGAQTLAAALGISATLLLAAGLSAGGIAFAHLDGLSDDLTLALGQQDSGISLQGVVLAGMLIGALGVLADTAVTQASAVMALRKTDPRLGAARLYRRAFVIGRDHLSATIHTLVLAYAGATLPLLLVAEHGRLGTVDALNTEVLAEPAVATVVGCVARSTMRQVRLRTGRS
jgi:hypothetical protein